MRVLGLWSFFHKYYVGVLHQNLEYLLFIFSIIYNLKRHRKIFLLIWLLLSFVITQTETPPKALPLIFQYIDWHKSQNEAQNLAQKKNLAHNEKLREMTNCVCSVENKIKTFKSWLFDKFFFKVGFAFRGRAAAQHETVINIGDIVSICVYY